MRTGTADLTRRSFQKHFLDCLMGRSHQLRQSNSQRFRCKFCADDTLWLGQKQLSDPGINRPKTNLSWHVRTDTGPQLTVTGNTLLAVKATFPLSLSLFLSLALFRAWGTIKSPGLQAHPNFIGSWGARNGCNSSRSLFSFAGARDKGIAPLARAHQRPRTLRDE